MFQAIILHNFHEKIMNQTWENDKKPNFGPDFDLFWQKFGPQTCFCRFYFYNMLYIVASYHCMQLQGKPTNQIWENGKKPYFGPNFDPFVPTPTPTPKFFVWILPLTDVRIVATYHFIQFKGKLRKPDLRK